jgi:hypothetical protein
MRSFLHTVAAVVLAGCAPKREPVAPTRSPPPARIDDATVDDGFELGGEPAPIGDERCNPFIAPVERREGDLVVHAPPDPPEFPAFRGRLRNHTEGALSRGSRRVWVGPQVPGFVPLTEGTQELTLLDRVGEEFLAFYRDPYGASTCHLSGEVNCGYTARLFTRCGEVKWTVRLGDFLSRPTYLEVQDIRYDGGVLYFNEACQSYAKGAKGRCSSLVAVDPQANTLLWRTPALVSNGRFLVHGDYLVTGYGFTRERDYVFVVRRRDGRVMQKRSVPSAPQDFVLVGDDAVDVILYPGDRAKRFRLRGWDGSQPRLVG